MKTFCIVYSVCLYNKKKSEQAKEMHIKAKSAFFELKVWF